MYLRTCIRLVALVALAGFTPASAQDVSFYAPRDYFNPELTGTAVSDFNSDGRPDVALTWKQLVTVVLNGGGTVTASAGATASADPIPADFNGDGRIDLAIVDAGGWVSVLLNDGAGSPLPPLASVIGRDPVAPVAGDFNGDGRADLAVIQRNRGVSISFGAGDGTFAAPTAQLTGFPLWMAAADYDGDGRLDLAVVLNAPAGNRTGVVLRGHGDGTFEELWWPTDYGAREVVAGDFNSDGHPDVVLVRIDSKLLLMLGEGDGTFEPGNSFATGPNPSRVLVHDLNTDGNPDLLLAAGGHVSYFQSRGNGEFAAGRQLPFAATSVAVADFNGDLTHDLAIRAGDSFGLRWGLPDGSFVMTPGFTDDAAVYVESVGSADFNSDGLADLAVKGINEIGGFIGVALGNGDGTFRSTAFASLYASRIFAFDVSGDGVADVIGVNDADPTATILAVLVSNGDGTVSVRYQYLPYGTRGVTMADLNSDGRGDLLLENSAADSSARAIVGLLNRGDGVFEPRLVLPWRSYFPGFAAADFTGDGTVDLAFCDSVGISVHSGLGDGTFAENPIQTPEPGWIDAVIAVDLDRDGRMDLVLRHLDGVTVRAGLGDGRFSPTVITLDVTAVPLAAADLNGDGLLDLVLAPEGQAHGIMVVSGRNDPLSLTLPPVSFATHDVQRGLAVADFNGDGRPDLAVGGHYGLSLLMNTTSN